MLGDRGADGVDYLADVDVSDPIAVDLLRDDERFGATRLRRAREGCPPTA